MVTNSSLFSSTVVDLSLLFDEISRKRTWVNYISFGKNLSWPEKKIPKGDPFWVWCEPGEIRKTFVLRLLLRPLSILKHQSLGLPLCETQQNHIVCNLLRLAFFFHLAEFAVYVLKLMRKRFSDFFGTLFSGGLASYGSSLAQDVSS